MDYTASPLICLWEQSLLAIAVVQLASMLDGVLLSRASFAPTDQLLPQINFSHRSTALPGQRLFKPRDKRSPPNWITATNATSNTITVSMIWLSNRW